MIECKTWAEIDGFCWLEWMIYQKQDPAFCLHGQRLFTSFMLWAQKPYEIFMRFYADIDKYLRNRIHVALPFTSSWKIRCISRTVYFQRLESNEVKHFAKTF